MQDKDEIVIHGRKYKRWAVEPRPSTSPPAESERPVCTRSPLCEGCPFPSHGFLCWGDSGKHALIRLRRQTRKVTVKAGQTASVTFTNSQGGTAKIVKTTTNGGALAGWHFEIKDANGNLVGNYVTDATGIITVKIPAGVYTVTETDTEGPYWDHDPNPSKTVTVVAGQTAEVSFTNKWIGKAKVVKQSTNGGRVNGWPFVLKDATGNTLGTYVTDSRGVIALDLNPGTYIIQEDLPEFADEYWVCDTTPRTFTVKAGETATVTFVNEWNGKAKIVKQATNGGRVEGWPFVVKDASGNPIGRFFTDSNGTIALDLKPGSYTVQEEKPDFADEYWVCDTTPRTITVKAGQTASVTFTNESGTPAMSAPACMTKM